MQLGMYCIQDMKTGFMTPTLDQNDLSAARNFASAVQQSQGVLFTHAEDFRLFKIADFNTDSGVVTPLSPQVLIAEGSAVVRGDQ